MNEQMKGNQEDGVEQEERQELVSDEEFDAGVETIKQFARLSDKDQRKQYQEAKKEIRDSVLADYAPIVGVDLSSVGKDEYKSAAGKVTRYIKERYDALPWESYSKNDFDEDNPPEKRYEDTWDALGDMEFPEDKG